MHPSDFSSVFEALTGSKPFPWQMAFYDRFARNDLPASANIPTGLGKTSIIAIWLIALTQFPDRVPRRLVYVVNRRTVVDQTTAVVERIRSALERPELVDVRSVLCSLCALPLPKINASPLAISTLRGQFADNGEWCIDPCRPAVITGTVDMIGSGLLFSRYTRSFRTRPLHAGLLAQDVLLIHDEAHLEPSFQKLLESISVTQSADGDCRKLRVIELTATSRSPDTNTNAISFGLDQNPNDKDTDNSIVNERINAVKRLSLVELEEGERLDARLVSLAKEETRDRAMIVFVRSVETAEKIAAELDKTECKGKVTLLTGTMRGKERDELVSKNCVFQRFLPEKDRASGITPAGGIVFLVATSAGEVGVNISADDLVCDLAPYESMAQRFGRVNRFGERNDTKIVVVHERKFESGIPLEVARERTLALLTKLGGSASPAALASLSSNERAAAFSPPPKLRIATDVQFDAWALTSIRTPIAARPPIAPYLHGESEWQPPETYVAWRKEIDELNTNEVTAAYPPTELLEDFPLKPHELLRDTTKRVFTSVKKIVERARATDPDTEYLNGLIAWLLNADGSVERVQLRRFLSDDTRETRVLDSALSDATLILPESLGGIGRGLLSPECDEGGADVADIDGERLRIWSDTPYGPSGFRVIRTIDTLLGDQKADGPSQISERYWLWLEAKVSGATNVHLSENSSETLNTHTAAVVSNALAITSKLFPQQSASSTIAPDLLRCLVLAARWHDLGKNRKAWQRNLGNLSYDPTKQETILAKSGQGMRARHVAEHYRHEFGSLYDAATNSEFAALSDTERDIVLHLVAAHHGRARPNFPVDEIGDLSNNAATPRSDVALATEIPRRFARLQKRFGRWGLAWLESLLRTADYAASSGIVASGSFESIDNPRENFTAQVVRSSLKSAQAHENETPTASLSVDPTNPGHYFACCGLFELATKRSPNVLSWFEQDVATLQWRFHLAHTPPLADILAEITSTEIATAEKSNDDSIEGYDEFGAGNVESEEKDASAPPLIFESPFNLRLDWWVTATGKVSALKIWAGSMKVHNIARSMAFSIQQSIRKPKYVSEDILSDFQITYDLAKIERRRWKIEQSFEVSLKKAEERKSEALKDAETLKSGENLREEKVRIANQFATETGKAKAKYSQDIVNITAKAKKIEPFYFDANRGPNAHSRDVGFAANDLKLETLASPAVEFLTLVGLQRATPAPVTDKPRHFDYYLWKHPLMISVLPAAVNGLLPDNSSNAFRFECWFRTGQRKHKAFITATTVSSP